MVSYVDAVVAVTAMRVLLLLRGCMVRECEGARVTAMLVWRRGDVVGMSIGNEYVGGTRGSGICSSTADVVVW